MATKADIEKRLDSILERMEQHQFADARAQTDALLAAVPECGAWFVEAVGLRVRDMPAYLDRCKEELEELQRCERRGRWRGVETLAFDLLERNPKDRRALEALRSARAETARQAVRRRRIVVAVVAALGILCGAAGDYAYFSLRVNRFRAAAFAADFDSAAVHASDLVRRYSPASVYLDADKERRALAVENLSGALNEFAPLIVQLREKADEQLSAGRFDEALNAYRNLREDVEAIPELVEVRAAYLASVQTLAAESLRPGFADELSTAQVEAREAGELAAKGSFADASALYRTAMNRLEHLPAMNRFEALVTAGRLDEARREALKLAEAYPPASRFLQVMLSLEQRTRTQSDLRDAAVQSRTERAVEALDQTLADARNAITRGEFDTADTALDKLAESQQQLPAMVAARDRARDLNQALNTPRCRMVMPTEFAEMASLDLKAATDADLGHIAAALDLWTQMFERLDGTLRPRCALEEAVEKGNLTRAAAEARALGDAYERAGQFLAAHEKLTACRNRLAQLTGRTDEYGGFLDAAKQRVARAESVLTQGRFEDAASALDAVVDFIGQAGDAVAARRTCADLLRQVEGRSVPDDLAGGLSAAKALAGQARQAAERAEAVQAAKSWTEASGLLESRVLPALRFEDALAASGGELEAAGLVEAARAVPDYARAQLYRQLVEQVQALRQKVTEVFQADPAPTIRDAVQRRFADAVAQAATGDLKGSREALTATADLLEGIDTMLAQRREIRQALDVLAKPPERDELTSDLQSLRTLDQSAQTACGENDLDRAAAQWQKARELLETPRVRFELALRNGRIDDALAIAAEGLADTYEPAGQALGLRDRLHECGEQVRELKKAARGKLAPAAAAVETEYTGVLAGMGTRGLPETADMLADIRNRLETLSKLNSLYNPFFGVMSGLDTSDLSDEGRRQIAAMQRMARRLDVLLDGQRFDGAYALLDGQRSEIAAFTASLDYWSRWHADSVDLVFVRVQKGRYYAAQGNEVVISAPTWMGQSEVTRSQFETVMGYLPSRASGTTADAPVDGIRFRDAADFCRTLTLKERDEGRLPLGMIYRLPSEAEWEYCSRAGNSQPLDIASVKYWFPEQSWYKENSGGALHAVGEREPNRWGLNDMFGNVWELCGDWSGNRLPAVRMVDPRGPQAGTEKVIRGGSCKSDMDVCLARADAPYERYYDLLGFRVVLARAPGTPEFRTVPAGVYQIGSIGGLFSGERGRKEDETRHSVRITKSYDIQTHEVTHREYEDVLGWIEGMAGRSAEDRQRPVSAVSWRDAVRYCETLTDLHRQAGLIDAQTRYRLPTEAEWEVACRAGSDLPFGFEGGDAKLGKHAWFAGSSGGDVKPVKALWPNEFGLYDMHGNVWEWCLDQCRREDPNARGPDVVVVTDTYRDGIVDPVGKEGPQRILRGGSYRSYSAQCRAAFRYALPPDTHLPDVGFRIVRDRVPPPGQDAPAPE